MPSGGTILLVEDEEDIASLVRAYLERDGFRVVWATRGTEGLAALEQHEVRLAILDLQLPDADGFDVCRAIRATSSLPVVMLTACDEEVDRVTGLELGADDYVTKPFSVRELVLRVKAVLKRGASGPAAADGEAPVHRAGPIEVDLGQHKVRIQGRSVDLTITEFKLLSDLVRARGRVRSRDILLSEVWGYDAEVMSRTVDTHIRRLRDKMGDAAAWLTTVRGVGYRIHDPKED